MRKFTINPSKKFRDSFTALASYLGYEGDITQYYAAIPRVLEFSMTYTVRMLEFSEKVIPFDFGFEMVQLVSTMEEVRKQRLERERLAELQEQAKNIIPKNRKKSALSHTKPKKRPIQNV